LQAGKPINKKEIWGEGQIYTGHHKADTGLHMGKMDPFFTFWAGFMGQR
jgi:hypothetical protein